MDELNEISNRLSGIKREEPFRVPEGYFDDLPHQIRDRIHQSGKTTERRRDILVLRPYLAAAVIIVVAIISGTLIFRSHQGSGSVPDLQTEISQVVEWELYSISEDDILEVMYDENFEEGAPAPESSDEIIDYLLNEDIPLDVLLNAL